MRLGSVTMIVIAVCCMAGCGNPYDTSAGDDKVPDASSGGPKFSFFYTSLDAMRRLSGSDDGFGGDLRFGMATGVEGADKICQTIAEDEGVTDKPWRAFLSATQGPDGRTVNAIDRIGSGPWYDRQERLISADLGGLIAERPLGNADAVNDLPDETGQGTSRLGTSGDVVTGSNKLGLLFSTDPRNTCMDWTDATIERVHVISGHAWLSGGQANWIEAHPELSCRPGVNLASTGVSDGTSIGAAGGWGGFYCFALSP